MQWFQYQPELVDRRPSVAHCTAEDPDDLQLESLCYQVFSRHQVVLTPEPGGQSSTANPLPGAPCVICLLRTITAAEPGAGFAVEAASADQPAETELPAEPSVVEGAEASTSADRRRRRVRTAIAVFLRRAQWLLDDAAHEIPAGRYSRTDATELAKTLEDLAQLIRHDLASRPHDAARPFAL